VFHETFIKHTTRINLVDDVDILISSVRRRRCRPRVVERASAHVEDNEVRRAYLDGEHLEGRVKMTDRLATEIDVVVSEQK
jgi:hypothetical protein